MWQADRPAAWREQLEGLVGAISYLPRDIWRLSVAFAELLFARGIFGYGERPLRPLVAGALVIAVWTMAYYLLGAVTPQASSTLPPRVLGIAECLHFSVVTFTTLGYGDLVPETSFRWLADVEALTGAALMAVFVVSLTRKYIR